MASEHPSAPLQAQLWRQLRQDALLAQLDSPECARPLDTAVLQQASFQQGLAGQLSRRLCCTDFDRDTVEALVLQSLARHPDTLAAACADLQAIWQRDPACTSLLQAFLFARGFQALQAHRVAHGLWQQGRRHLALMLQQRVAERYAIDIHPAARIGRGVFIDHGHGIVIGETAVVGDEVAILHEVTLGGTGKERGDRHPIVRNGALLCAGAKILGRVVVGEGAKVAACSVVLDHVPPFSTVAGIPARLVRAAQLPDAPPPRSERRPPPRDHEPAPSGHGGKTLAANALNPSAGLACVDLSLP